MKGKEKGRLPVGQQEEKVLLERSDWDATIETLWIELEVNEGDYDILQVRSLQL